MTLSGPPWRRFVAAWDAVVRAGVPFAGRYSIAEPILGCVSGWWAVALAQPANEFTHVYQYRVLRSLPTEWGAVAAAALLALALLAGFCGYVPVTWRADVLLVSSAWWTYVAAAILYSDHDAPAFGTYLGLGMLGLFGYLRFRAVIVREQ